MRKTAALAAIVLALAVVSCGRETENPRRPARNGELSKEMEAVKREYTLSRQAVFKELKARIPDVSEADVKRWEADDSLEYYLIDGERRYYANCVSDLFRVNPEAARRAKIPEDKGHDASPYPLETIASFEKGAALSRKITVAFTFFQDIGGLPEHSVLKAWIPYVRENRFQSDIRIVRSSVADIRLPQSGNLTSMIYFEKAIDRSNNANGEWRNYFAKPPLGWMKPMRDAASIGDAAFVCQFIYEYQAMGHYQKIDPASIRPYGTSDPDYRKYTEETGSNAFTPYLKKLSAEIVGGETNDYLKARKIYEWICRNVVWTDPKPVLGDPAEYTARHRRGDCGAKSNLFISLCRIHNIPARPQGGWRVQPDGDHAQHSWAQVYFEPYGWLPVDATVGAHLIDHRDERVRYFYFGNCTPYHLIIYDDGEELLPAKAFEPIHGGGAQLGAFEWSGGDMEPYIKIDSHVE